MRIIELRAPKLVPHVKTHGLALLAVTSRDDQHGEMLTKPLLSDIIPNVESVV